MTQRVAIRNAISIISKLPEDNTEMLTALEKLATQLDKHAKRATELNRTKQEEKRD
jgi:hypothetical protein